MSDASAFSPDYTAARARFRSSAIAAGARLSAYPIDRKGPDGDELTIDVARVGPDRATHTVVVSSGLHGVEGFLGSAVQAALLEDRLAAKPLPVDTALVLVHALNPYGFAWIRRVNEDNVDLNRNFLLKGEPYTGSPDQYAQLDGLLNPKEPPSSLEPFLLKAAIQIARHGMPALKDAVAGGQYEFPQGLFFGGERPSRTMELLREHLPSWVAGATKVLHVDIHTGLGKSGTYKLLVDRTAGSPEAQALAERFGGDFVQPWDPSGVSYKIRGGLGTWCQERLPQIAYDVLAAEVGTTSILEVIAALRMENRAHHWGEPTAPTTKRAKDRLKEAFAPSSRAWRDQSVAAVLGVVDRAIG